MGNGTSLASQMILHMLQEKESMLSSMFVISSAQFIDDKLICSIEEGF